MSLIRRITATITSSVDRAVGRIENHNAIIEAALKDTRRAAARSRVRLERLRKDGRALSVRRQELEEASARWAERARAVAAEDEAKALDCLRRRRDCEAQLQQLREAIDRHEELEQRIGQQVVEIETRIREINQQRTMLLSRQSVAEAMHAMNRVEGSCVTDIEDAFDRWEVNIADTEIQYGAAVPADPLDRAFRETEDEAELRAELGALLDDDREGSP